MDVTDLRIAATLMSFATFIAIVVWVYSRGRVEDFDEAARLPFATTEESSHE